MTAAPRRRRHDPLPPAGAGRVEPPGPSTIDLHTHTTRSDGVVAPAELVRQAAAVGVRLLALTDHDTLAGYRDVVAAGAVPDGLTLLPGVEINAIVTRDLGLWEGELHILGFGMDPADDAFEAVLAAQRDRRRERFERTVALLRELDLLDRRPDRPHRGGRRRRPRPPDGRPRPRRGRSRGERRGRVHAPARRGASRRTCRGPGSARSRRSPRSAPPAASRCWPISARRAARVEVVRELVEAGLGGLEVYYRSFDMATVASRRRGRRRRSAWSRPAAPTTTATSARTPRRTPSCGSRRRSRRRSSV